MIQLTNAQWFRLFDLIGEGFQSEYNPIRMEEIGGQIRELAREMFPSGEEEKVTKIEDIFGKPCPNCGGPTWRCEQCGEAHNPVDSSWRFNGRDWEHHHGYPIGHVSSRRFGCEKCCPAEDPNPVKSKSVLKRLAVQKPGSRAYPGYLDPEGEEKGGGG